MLLDIIILIAIALAGYKGFKRGLVVSALSFIAIFIGLLVAFKISSTVVKYVENEKEPATWYHIAIFFLILIGVILLIQLIARAVRGTLRLVQLGLLDSIGGAIFHVVVYLFVLSFFILYANMLGFLPEELKSTSITYHYLSPLAPKTLSFLGKIFPVFNDLFELPKKYQ
ncbi:MAG TPA: CvpA family protein [Ginsengibacter sp.]|nr:CvpA family protein [Ginsengibacter sp.]HRP16688.1 CvpA family protein [Ginsengibacter sp.]HRP43358.1 CvpA family protein [Ginsengibacter sp.]